MPVSAGPLYQVQAHYKEQASSLLSSIRVSLGRWRGKDRFASETLVFALPFPIMGTPKKIEECEFPYVAVSPRLGQWTQPPVPLPSADPSIESGKAQSGVLMSQTHGNNAHGRATCSVSQRQPGSR